MKLIERSFFSKLSLYQSQSKSDATGVDFRKLQPEKRFDEKCRMRSLLREHSAEPKWKGTVHS